MQSCAAAGCPYGWQQVPDWPDGSYFWMAAPAVAGTAVSQSDGKFIVGGLAPGLYTVRVTGSGLQTIYYTGRVSAEDGESALALAERGRVVVRWTSWRCYGRAHGGSRGR